MAFRAGPRALIPLAAASLAWGTAGGAGLHFGPVAGLNYSNLRWESQSYVYPENRLGLAAGGYLAADLDPRVQLRAELWFSDKGGGASYSAISNDSASGLDLTRDYRTSSRLSYLELPLFVNLMISRGDNQLGVAGIGPYFGWLLDGELRTEMDVSASSVLLYSSEYRLGTGDFRRADFGATAALAAYVYDFEVNVRYSVGMRRVLDREFEDINRLMDPLNRVWSISVGYQIK